MSETQFIISCDEWMRSEGPMHHSIVSSRARYARNLPQVPFAPRASNVQLREIVERFDEALDASPFFAKFRRISVPKVDSLHRLYLKESHLLSPEMEQGQEGRVLYVNPNYRISLMINEEDHLRIQVLDTGFQLGKVLAVAQEVERELASQLPFAYSHRLGHLTACPTNVGSGLRLSIMLHLPGLVLIDKIGEIIQSVSQYGLTVRGIYGENSDNLGDFFQISNEVTLGRTEDELRATLESVAEQVVERELAARDALFEQKPLIAKDLICRALAALQNAWIMDSAEALSHLSKIRLGIDRGHFRPITHPELSRLMVEIQPGHLQCRVGRDIPTGSRDGKRAELLHQRLRSLSYN